jgi:hypothetical protein
MKNKPSKYNIGDSWIAETTSGKSCTIWFHEIDRFGNEIFRYSASYDDGSGMEFDYAYSLVTCKKYAPSIKGRWKKIKKGE